MSEKHNETDVHQLLSQAEQSDDVEQLRHIWNKLIELSAWNAAAFVNSKIMRLERKYAEEVWK